MLTTFDHARLFGTRHGSGTPTVLALHGWRRSSSDFDRLFAVGTAGSGGQDATGGSGALNGIALDLPGFGATPEPEEPWGSPEYARAVLPVLAEMGPRVILVGHSFGGRVAVHVARIADNQVSGIVLTGAPLLGPIGGRTRSPLKFRVVKRLARAHLVPEKTLRDARERHGSADYRAAEGVMRAILVKSLQEDYTAQISALRCPVELVWGEDDTAAPLDVATRLESAFGNARLTVCPGAGHLTPLTVPEQLRAAVDRLSA